MDIKLTDVPYGDYYQIIYRLEKDNETRVYTNYNPHLNKEGFYEITFQDMINEIEAKENCKISSFTMLAESGLEGVVYRYNSKDNELYECGSTRGYA